jgi:hypothetical protein
MSGHDPGHLDLRPPRYSRTDDPIAPRGKPNMIVSDHGMFKSNAILAWSNFA